MRGRERERKRWAKKDRALLMTDMYVCVDEEKESERG
jgi:hypothetical protein